MRLKSSGYENNRLSLFRKCQSDCLGQSYKIAGTVLDAKSKVPVEFATLWIEGSGIGTMTDSQGKFVIQHLAEGKHEVLVRCLGYSECKLQLDVRKDKETSWYIFLNRRWP